MYLIFISWFTSSDFGDENKLISKGFQGSMPPDPLELACAKAARLIKMILYCLGKYFLLAMGLLRNGNVLVPRLIYRKHKCCCIQRSFSAAIRNYSFKTVFSITALVLQTNKSESTLKLVNVIRSFSLMFH